MESTQIVNGSEIEEPPVKTKPDVDSEVLSSIDPMVLEDSYVYVHCTFHNTASQEMLVRIWKTTFLIDRSSGSKSELLHAENISFAPVWTMISPGQSHSFLLIFSSLPKTCTHFDMVEEIEQVGGFHISNIVRNSTDVYHVAL